MRKRVNNSIHAIARRCSLAPIDTRPCVDARAPISKSRAKHGQEHGFMRFVEVHDAAGKDTSKLPVVKTVLPRTIHTTIPRPDHATIACTPDKPSDFTFNH